jgi:F0F1-type ATP synthase membrane subunit a
MKYKYIIFVIIILTICFLLLLFFSKNDKVKTSPKNVQEQTEEDIELLLN